MKLQIEKNRPILASIRAQTKDADNIFGVFGRGRLYRLDSVPKEDFVAEGLTIHDPDGYRIYYHTVLALFIAALAQEYPNLHAEVEHFIGDALYVAPAHGDPFTSEQLEQVEKTMRVWIDADIPMKRRRTEYKKALEILAKEGREDAVMLYRHLPEEPIDLIDISGHHFAFHNYLAPSARFAQSFGIQPYYPGLLLLFETPESRGEIPPFEEQRNLAKTYRRSKTELQLLHLETVGQVNAQIRAGRSRHMVHMIDLQMENRLRQLAEEIHRDDDIRLILVAGPSSSGKTTFSKKLSGHLGAMGKFPVTVSMDDYFVDRANTPLDADGTPNFEAVDAIDIDRFNRDMLHLLEGREVQMPRYDFLTGKSCDDGSKIRIDRHHPMIIEGIHGLHPRISRTIPEKNKIKIYISALTQLNIDYNNRIAATDVRFLRRLVRDHAFRGHDAERTFELWQKVRKAEDEEIFPFQEQADHSIDTSLVYDLFVLKPYAEKLLRTIPRESTYWKDAKRLLRFLHYFLPIDEDHVADTSLLREFIGGSHYGDDAEWM